MTTATTTTTTTLPFAFSSSLSPPSHFSFSFSFQNAFPSLSSSHFSRTRRSRDWRSASQSPPPPHDRLLLPRALHDSTMKEEAEEEQISLLTSISSQYNDILILETPTSRLLLLDQTRNVHSIYNKGEKWTDAYWDDFATLPAIVPQGPIAILGLGGGTAAHLMLDVWPSLKLEGWEIDKILIDKAREYLGLVELEKYNKAGGILHVHAGDALSPSVMVPGGFAGIIVDLFYDGKVLPELQKVATWLELSKKLMKNGRIMVNCAGYHSEAADTGIEIDPNDSSWLQNCTIKALCQAFPQNLSWKKRAEGEGENYLALTGPFPDLDVWSAAVPSRLSSAVRQWWPCELE